LHTGATEAFKRLNDTYQRLANGESRTALVLPLEKSGDASGPPPKIISVKTHK
jgi:hypothetical protein